jgi:hypothetical protein
MIEVRLSSKSEMSFFYNFNPYYVYKAFGLEKMKFHGLELEEEMWQIMDKNPYRRSKLTACW